MHPGPFKGACVVRCPGCWWVCAGAARVVLRKDAMRDQTGVRSGARQGGEEGGGSDAGQLPGERVSGHLQGPVRAVSLQDAGAGNRRAGKDLREVVRWGASAPKDRGIWSGWCRCLRVWSVGVGRVAGRPTISPRLRGNISTVGHTSTSPFPPSPPPIFGGNSTPVFPSALAHAQASRVPLPGDLVLPWPRCPT